MRNRKRMQICLSLLLAGALCVSGGADIWANEESELVQETDSVTDASNLEELEEKTDAEEQDNIVKEEDSEGLVLDNAVLEDTMPQENPEDSAVLSENEENPEPFLSGNDLSSNQNPEESAALSENEENISGDDLSSNASEQQAVSDNAESEEQDSALEEEAPLEVILPSSISLKMLVFGKDKLSGMIESEQFCIENTSHEDVKISLQATCSGENEENYVIGGSSAMDSFVPGKKNVWAYLQWENESRELLPQPKIVLGDASNPGQGEILLKAPDRNEEDEIIGENPESKAYFSFGGDMKSDTGEKWKDGELKLKLNFFMERAEEENPNLPIEVK